ncbi:sulfatase [Halalkalibaculum sp. DA384]|uniref:sulfatase family protein n=1 Tax=Halalkalibaculum sp. DA384 TaxID=3373606 RepID=UPI00375478BA
MEKYKRIVVCVLLSGLYALHPVQCYGQNGSLDTPPNILFVISDDQSWPHAGIYGAKEIATPAFDRIAREGVLFNNAFAAAPQCSPNRAAILTGRNIWQLEEAGTHASNFPQKFRVFPDLLEQAGYEIGYTGKGWGPGNWKYNGWDRNPAGVEYSDQELSEKPVSSVSNLDYAANFRDFYEGRDQRRPFFFWVGTYEPHRVYEENSGIKSGKDPQNIEVPAFLPDTPEIRSDLLDYYVEIEWFDQQLGHMINLLEKNGELENTLVVVTSDNGMPFPRAKANLYEYGTHVPLAIRWPEKIGEGRIVDDLVSSIDFFPTFLDVAGADIPEQVTGRSLLPLLMSQDEEVVNKKRSAVLTGRERHTHARPENLGYPSRSIRTQDYLFIRNLKPERWPAGDPRPENRADLTAGDFKSFGRGYADIDGSPTKAWMLDNRDRPAVKRLFQLAFEKRPSKELYNITKDPACLNNLAGKAEYRSVQNRLEAKLDSLLKVQNDPRVYGYDIFESYPRYSPMRNFPGFKERGEYNFDF